MSSQSLCPSVAGLHIAPSKEGSFSPKGGGGGGGGGGGSTIN